MNGDVTCAPVGRVSARGSAGSRERASGRRRDPRGRDGQALVELAICLPFMLLLLGGSYTIWNGLNTNIGMVGGARAATIAGAGYFRGGVLVMPLTPANLNLAEVAARNAINSEENTNIFVAYQQGMGGCTTACVTIADPIGPTSHVQMISITVTRTITPQVAGFPALNLRVVAAAAVPS